MPKLIPEKLLEVQLWTGIPQGSRRSHQGLTEHNPPLNTTKRKTEGLHGFGMGTEHQASAAVLTLGNSREPGTSRKTPGNHAQRIRLMVWSASSQTWFRG